MKKSKEIIVNGKAFEFMGCTDRRSTFSRGLYECYDDPSATKVDIWHRWVEWFSQQGSTNYAVYSYNCHFFTIVGEIKMGDIDYFIEITYAHNRIWIINK